MAETNNTASSDEYISQEGFWPLKFDPATNFSLLGFFLGGGFWEGNDCKSVDMDLS